MGLLGGPCLNAWRLRRRLLMTVSEADLGQQDEHSSLWSELVC